MENKKYKVCGERKLELWYLLGCKIAKEWGIGCGVRHLLSLQLGLMRRSTRHMSYIQLCIEPAKQMRHR